MFSLEEHGCISSANSRVFFFGARDDMRTNCSHTLETHVGQSLGFCLAACPQLFLPGELTGSLVMISRVFFSFGARDDMRTNYSHTRRWHTWEFVSAICWDSLAVFLPQPFDELKQALGDLSSLFFLTHL